MLTFIKWVLMLIVAGLAWLVGKYTAEYFAFNPYKKFTLPKYK